MNHTLPLRFGPPGRISFRYLLYSGLMIKKRKLSLIKNSKFVTVAIPSRCRNAQQRLEQRDWLKNRALFLRKQSAGQPESFEITGLIREFNFNVLCELDLAP